MTTDKELLELAAKAAGFNFFWSERLECGEVWQGGDKTKRFWQPHRDDGDALRLAVQLRMEIDHNHPADASSWVSVSVADRFGVEEFDDEAQRLAATRRVIVRAAAEIGKVMA